MDLAGMDYQGMHSQNRNVHRRTPHATQYVQSGDQVYGSAQDMDSWIAGTASSDSFIPDMFSGCVDWSTLATPETAPGYICEVPVYAHQLYVDTIHHPADAYQSGTEPSQMQPQEDNHPFQVNLVHPATGGFRENHWPRPPKAPQGDFPSGFCVDNANLDGPLGALNCQDWDTCYYGSLLPCNPTHKFHGSLFHSDSLSLASLPVREATSTAVPPDLSSSLHPITNLVNCPNMGYNSASDTYAVAADIRITGSKVEIGDTVRSPMLNYHRTPSTQLLPPPPAERTQPMSNDVGHPADFEVSRNTGPELQQIVWSSSTGESVLVRAKRSVSDADRAESQMIRSLGGQCKKCKKDKRKCKVSHLQARSDASPTSPSAKTCSSSESSLVLVSTHKRRKVDQPDVHAQSRCQSLEPARVDGRQQGTDSASGRSPSRENRSKSISSAAGTVGSADTPPPSEPGTIVSSTVDVDIANFSQYDLAFGGQFMYGKSPSPNPQCLASLTDMKSSAMVQ